MSLSLILSIGKYGGFYLTSGSDEGAREDPVIYGGDEVPPASSGTKHISR